MGWLDSFAPASLIRILRIKHVLSPGPHSFSNFRQVLVIVTTMILRGHWMWFMGNLTLTQSCKLCLLNANVTKLQVHSAHLATWLLLGKWAGSQSCLFVLGLKNEMIFFYSPSHWGDRLLAGVGDVLLLVLPGVVEHQCAASRVGHDPWNGGKSISQQR